MILLKRRLEGARGDHPSRILHHLSWEPRALRDDLHFRQLPSPLLLSVR
jgi:hypothetical protein